MGTQSGSLGGQAKSFFTFGHIVAVIGIGALGYAAFFSAIAPRVGILVGVICFAISYLLKKG